MTIDIDVRHTEAMTDMKNRYSDQIDEDDMESAGEQLERAADEVRSERMKRPGFRNSTSRFKSGVCAGMESKEGCCISGRTKGRADVEPCKETDAGELHEHATRPKAIVFSFTP